MFLCSGGGPLRREELGDWAGMAPKPAPDAKQLEALVRGLKTTTNMSFIGRFSLPGDASVFSLNCGQYYEVPFTPAPGLVVKGRMNPWLHLLPTVCLMAEIA